MGVVVVVGTCETAEDACQTTVPGGFSARRNGAKVDSMGHEAQYGEGTFATLCAEANLKTTVSFVVRENGAYSLAC